MVMIKSEFFLALNQVATERGISPDDVINSIKLAVLAAYKKDYTTIEETDENFEVIINKETGETKIFLHKKDVTPPGFGRIAAQTARQVILQKIREAEKKTVAKHYQSLVGTLVKGRIIKFEGPIISVDIGKAEGIMPYEEQIKNEEYALNTSYTFLIKEIRKDAFGNFRIILSRSAPLLIAELFKKEVPEIAQGTVEIKKVVREPGERAKVAVFSAQSGIDPVGACVGQKGIRVKSVTEGLGGIEKIDIIQYNDDDAIFIREALSPTTIHSIEIDTEKKHAKVFVEEKQAPVAIGKNGVNVNLASRLSNYEIDIIQLPSTEKVPAPESAIPTPPPAKETLLEKTATTN
ncbi:MAG TPA: transcription termination factor NusA [Patescibacteria group bacterium]|nr:transcription termination factor NusA [Patescibacteria group bacterium]